MARLNRFAVAPLHAMTRRLAAVAAGRAEPDTIVTGARLLSTYSERILPDREVWIAGGRIAAIKPAGAGRRAGFGRIRDAAGAMLAPGLVDPHVHIESSMVTACAYAEAALLNGTTTVFCDSHEIGNVMDVDGIEAMLRDAREAPLSIFLTVPSTVPATSPELETAGGDLDAGKVAGLFERWPEAVALGEKMDFVPVAAGDERAHAIIAAALERGRPVSGHVYGREFVAAYAASGVTDTHEAIDREIADDLLEAGLWVFLRGGPPSSPWHSLPQAIRAVTELGASTKRVAVCTDDRDADDLFLFGLDHVVREANRHGLPAERAWAMGSLHGATRFGMGDEIGGLGGGRRADLVLMNDDLEPVSTWYGGELVVEDGRITDVLDAALTERYAYPRSFYASVRLPERRALLPELPAGKCVANLIGIEAGAITTAHVRADVDPTGGWAAMLAEHRLTFVAVVERHGRSAGNVSRGLLQGFGLARGAVASSVGHDSHNVIVAGQGEADMQLALATIEQHQGGVCVVCDGAVEALVPLPIAGLLSDKRAPEVADEVRHLKAAWSASGCSLPFMGFNLLPLAVIPEVRITDRGLVAVPAMRQLPLFE